MQANELRIGNWVNHLEHGFIKVNDLPYMIDADNSKEGYLINEMWIDEHKPIPLTPEILEKCGFEKEGITSMSLSGFPCYFKIDKGSLECYGIHWVGKIIQIECQYLHQLQNLYFSLTNQELQINL